MAQEWLHDADAVKRQADGLVVEADALRAEGARLKALLLRAATFDDDGETVCSDCGADVDSDGNLTCECYA